MTPMATGRRPRWDDDTTGTGVASAEPLLPAIEAFRARAGDEGWVAEDPVHHLGETLDAWLQASERPFRDATWAVDGPWLVIQAIWTDQGGLRDLRADAYALLGSFAEAESFVRQRVDPQRRAVVFECATGLSGEVFAPHGHLVRLEVRGVVAERVADEHARIGDTAQR
jgi:hypothetical protein